MNSNSENIKIKDIKSKDLINELFDIFTQIGYDWDFDLPSHPVIDKFKEHIKQKSKLILIIIVSI